jgi:hypothetical protein
MTKKDLSRRQGRWLEKLSDFQFEIKHVLGKENGAANALSRQQVAETPRLSMLQEINGPF